jgi:hypothetical protein
VCQFNTLSSVKTHSHFIAGFFITTFTCCVLFFHFLFFSLEIKLSMLYMLLQMASSVFLLNLILVCLAIAKLLGWEVCVYHQACFQILYPWMHLGQDFHPECLKSSLPPQDQMFDVCFSLFLTYISQFCIIIMLLPGISRSSNDISSTL